MTDYYKTARECLREAQEKANKYDELIEKLKNDSRIDEELRKEITNDNSSR